MEETNNNPKIGKKSQSPKKLIMPKEEQNNFPKVNMTEQVSNKSKTFLITPKLTQEFDAEEEEEMSIKYKEQDKKIKLITLDYLLKKIIFENFIEKNPIIIYSFCQQCYCFLDKELLFNKIFNCYNYYKEKKIPMNQLGNLIKFLNILVIEMYEYYTKLNIDDPAVALLKNIYNNIFFEICELINNEAEQKNEEERL